MNKNKKLDLILGTLAIAGVSVSSATTSLANNNELFIKTNEASKSSDKYTVNWTKKLGAEREDKFYKVIPTSDKGYVAIGESALTETTGFSSGDAIIVKFNSKGEEVWRDVLEGDESDRYYSVVELLDGGFMAFGTSYSTNLDFENSNRKGNAIAVLYEADGTRLAVSNHNEGSKALTYKDAVVMTNGSVVAVCGEIKSNIGGDAIEKDSIITDSIHKFSINQSVKSLNYKKVDSTKLKQKNLNTELIIGDMIATSDNHILVSGYEYATDSNDTSVHFVMKVNESFDEEWITEEDVYGSTIITNSIFESKNGAVYVAGEITSTDDNDDSNALLIKLNAETGDNIWSTTIGEDKYDSFNSVSVDANGDVLVVGLSNSPLENTTITGDKTEIIIAKFNDKNSNILDIANLGADTKGIVVNSAFQDESGNLIIAGKQGFATGDEACDLINPCTQFDAVLLSVKENLEGTEEDVCDTSIPVSLIKNEATFDIGERFDIFEYIKITSGYDKSNITITTDLSKDGDKYYAENAGTYYIDVKFKDDCQNNHSLSFKAIIKDPSCPINPPEITAKDEYTYYIGDDFDAMKLITFKGLDTSKIKNSNAETVDGITTTTVEYESGDKIVVVSNLDLKKEGSYYVKYTLKNQCGEAKKEIKVNAKNKTEGNSPEGNTDKPQTGDNTLVYAGLGIASITGLVLLNTKKGNKNKEENNINSDEIE